MKINLRKASVIQDNLLDEIKLQRKSASLEVQPYSHNPLNKMNASEEAFKEAHKITTLYLKVRCELRSLVARKNAEVGVTDLLAQDNMLQAQEVFLKEISTASPRLDDEAVLAYMESIKHREERRFGDAYTLDVLRHDDLRQLQEEFNELRKARRRLKDELVTLNVTHTIEVSEEAARVISELGFD